jgi:hypothetical protein
MALVFGGKWVRALLLLSLMAGCAMLLAGMVVVWGVAVAMALAHGGWSAVALLHGGDGVQWLFPAAPPSITSDSYQTFRQLAAIPALAGMGASASLAFRWWKHLVIKSFRWLTEEEASEMWKHFRDK